MERTWAIVPNFGGRYEVSDDGEVRHTRFKRILKCNSKGTQKSVSIVMNGKPVVYEVRQLMAYAFLGADATSTTRPKLIHKDGNLKNIHLSNLELADYSDLENEIWKDIQGYEGIYQVSNLGRVKRLAHEDVYYRKDTNKQCHRPVGEKILKLLHAHDGYLDICLMRNGADSYYAVHRLVAAAFIPNPENKPQVNHIDGNRSNNVVHNLEWCTCQENVQDQIRRSGRDACIAAIRKVQGRQLKCIETQQIFASIGEASCQLGCDSGAIPSSIERRSCCFGWTFIYLDIIESLNTSEIEYMNQARAKYFKWPRAKIKEVIGWTNMYSPEA